MSIDTQGLIICPVTQDDRQPTFSEPECSKTDFSGIDPQDRAIWVKATISLPQTWLEPSIPLGVFIFAKSSSEVYVNGHFLGRNGTPSLNPDEEFPGNIDTVFFLPTATVQATNTLVLKLSTHLGILDLAGPIHFIGIGDFAAPASLFQSSTYLSMILLGTLLLGTLYFLVLCIQSSQPREHALFLLMGILASSQLALETLRNLYAYPYPLHDLRLILIVLLSMGFGLCLLAFVARKFAERYFWRWLGGSTLMTIAAVLIIPFFDTKTASAILIPALCATLLISVEYCRDRRRELLSYLIMFVSFDLVAVFTLSTFHSLTYYLLIALLTALLFVGQARTLSREQQQRREEQQRTEKLAFRLEQLQEKSTPSSIVVRGAGEITHISTDNIRYCKAAGDYVELHLKEGLMQLYSGTLKGLERNLPKTFLRVHRSYLVNLDLVSSLKSISGIGTLALHGGDEIPVSRRVMPAVRDSLKGTLSKESIVLSGY